MVEIFDNIRKLYQFKPPCEELADCIEFFSETSLDATRQYITTEEFTVKLFPSYTPTIWINLGSPYYLKTPGKFQLIDEQTDVLLLRNGIVERKNLPTDNIFTVKFIPGGFEMIFGISQSQIGNSIVNANTIIHTSVIQRLKKAGTFDKRLLILQNWFLKRTGKKNSRKHHFQYINDAVNAFASSGMRLNNAQLARELCLTDKTLYRYFKNVVGTHPKNYLAIVRARAALTAYVTGKEKFSPCDFGYYDQSHFYKDVIKFTGQKLLSDRS